MAFVMLLVLFTVIHAVLFMALYCTVKWKWGPGRASSTYKMHEWAGDCGRRETATKAKIYESNIFQHVGFIREHTSIHPGAPTTALLKYSVSALSNTCGISTFLFVVR